MILGPILILAGYASLYMSAGWKVAVGVLIIHAGDYVMHYNESIVCVAPDSLDPDEFRTIPPKASN